MVILKSKDTTYLESIDAQRITNLPLWLLTQLAAIGVIDGKLGEPNKKKKYFRYKQLKLIKSRGYLEQYLDEGSVNFIEALMVEMEWVNNQTKCGSTDYMRDRIST